MDSIVGAKLGEDIRDVPQNFLLADLALVGDLFVRVPACDQSEHIDLA
jgi:hypothetical protein